MTTRQYLGVRQKRSGRFYARIWNDATSGREYIGTFDTAEEAARAFDARAVQLGGPRRKLDFPHEHRAGSSGGSQQQAAVTASGNPKSMYAGVQWSSSKGLWQAKVRATGRPSVLVGYFGSEVAAASAYNAKVLELGLQDTLRRGRS
jgi:hypothetical protein